MKQEAARWRTSNEVLLLCFGHSTRPFLCANNFTSSHAFKAPQLLVQCQKGMHAVCALQESRLAAEAEVAEIRAKVEAIERETRAKMAALSEVEERQAEREAELGLKVSKPMLLEPWQRLPKHAFVSKMRSHRVPSLQQSYSARYPHFPENTTA